MRGDYQPKRRPNYGGNLYYTIVFSALMLILMTITLWPGTSLGQDVPPPKPKPQPSETVSAKPKASRLSGPTLLLVADMDCRLKFDGTDLGKLKDGDSKKVTTSLGEHLIEAVSSDGKYQWKRTISLDKATQTVVDIDLREIVAAHDEQEKSREADARKEQQRREEVSTSTWIDPKGSMWLTHPSNPNLSWREADSYCKSFRLGSFIDWRLPTLMELERLHDPSNPLQWVPDSTKLRAGSGPVVWTATPAGSPGSFLAVRFRVSDVLELQLDQNDTNGIALCVRNP
jgi:Protein of unknown function (DUF1566)